jgi:hypothetical protein
VKNLQATGARAQTQVKGSQPLQTSCTPLSQGADTAALPAMIAAQQGQSFYFILDQNSTTYFHLATIDRLEKSQAAKPVGELLKEIPRPEKITNLRRDMGLSDNQRLYSHCRVSPFSIFQCCLPPI